MIVLYLGEREKPALAHRAEAEPLPPATPAWVGVAPQVTAAAIGREAGSPGCRPPVRWCPGLPVGGLRRYFRPVCRISAAAEREIGVCSARLDGVRRKDARSGEGGGASEVTESLFSGGTVDCRGWSPMAQARRATMVVAQSRESRPAWAIIKPCQ